MNFNSRRSPVFSLKGIAASTQPLATDVGQRILRNGGNAADAAVAMAAALNVTEPTSTGIGGDCFCLYFDAKTKSVHGVNGSGRCATKLSIDKLNELGVDFEKDPRSIHTITVPGSAAGWVDTIDKFGKLPLAKVLEPAIELAEKGFPVSPVTADMWKKSESLLLQTPNGREMLLNDRAPKTGEIMRMPNLAGTFREIAQKGKSGFYEGAVADAIVQVVKESGGFLSHDDLKSHTSTFDTPIKVNYRGVDVWEIPPSGQGITALMALNILNGFDLSESSLVDYLHVTIESLRLAFADTRYYVADPSKTSVPVEGMLSPEYAAQRRQLIDPTKASADVTRGSPTTFSNTVYLCVVDEEGNACSFINSNYMGFGTGIVPKGCGFTLQNRGSNFSLDKSHPNCLEGGKRPYHTIIPGMATKDGELWAAFGVMGAFMQPQGHVQVLQNMIDKGMDPQAALDAPRFYIQDGEGSGVVCFEEGISQDTIDALEAMGHKVNSNPIKGDDRFVFGRGQIIRRDPTGVLWGGSDPRGDGHAGALS